MFKMVYSKMSNCFLFKALDPETAEKIDQFIQKLKNLQKLETEFTVLIDDPSGNSFVENPYPFSFELILHDDQSSGISWDQVKVREIYFELKCLGNVRESEKTMEISAKSPLESH